MNAHKDVAKKKSNIAIWDTFHRLSFFSRIVCGFAFMGLLVAIMGTAAFSQVNNIAAITHKIYDEPLQVNNASLRIKSPITNLTRQLKNMAIQPHTSSCQNVTAQLQTIDEKIQGDLSFIATHHPNINNDTAQLNTAINRWKNQAFEACALFEQKSYEQFAVKTLHDVQDDALGIIAALENISLQAQQQITYLNRTADKAENEAKRILVFIVFGFMLVGFTVTVVITRSLARQFMQLRDAMRDIAAGKDISQIPLLDHPKEMGDMARGLAIFKEIFSNYRQLERSLRQVIEAMPNGVIMVNAHGTIEIVNRQAEEIFGYDRSELIGKSVDQLVPKAAASTHAQNRDAFFSNPSPRIMGAGRELFGLRRDGSEFPLEIGLAPLDTQEGMKVLASVVDITERRNANIALDNSRERLELTTKINQIGVWEFMVDDGTLIWNDAMFEIYGRNKDFFSADYKAWQQSVHPDDLPVAEKLLQDSIANLTSFNCKFRIIQPDGTIKYIQAKARVDRKANKHLRVLGTNIDITREEIAIAKLQNLEALRSAIVEFSEDAIISKTPQGIITSWNLGARNMFGYSEEEVIGKPIKDLLFPPDLVHQEEMLLAQVRSGSVVKHFETVRRCKDGRLINVSITLSPIKDGSGKMVGISAIKRDISEHIRNAQMLERRQQELERSNKELARSNKELETFAYVASHDLKSPLRGIVQLSTWVEEDLDAGEYETVKQHTHLLRNRIQRMEKLLDDLLIFYRAGKTGGALSEVNVHQMVNEIFEIQNTKPGLRLDIKNDLPTLTTLSTPFEQIIRNLFSNAIKHHDKDEGVIQISSKPMGEFIAFSVCDDGPGIPEKFQQRIFGMFQTLKPRDELEGSGMGLALIKKLVENYGGQVKVHSEGRGACFTFTWPQNIQRSQDHD